MEFKTGSLRMFPRVFFDEDSYFHIDRPKCEKLDSFLGEPTLSDVVKSRSRHQLIAHKKYTTSIDRII
jgi:hypothetical protein